MMTHESYHLQFEPDEVDEVPALKKLLIDANLCNSVMIRQIDDGRFFVTWSEEDLKSKLPPKHYVHEITRR